MKISHNLKQDTSQKRIVHKQLKLETKQNIFNNKLERKQCQKLEVEIGNKINERKLKLETK